MSLTLSEIKTAQISDELVTIKNLSYVNNKYFAFRLNSENKVTPTVVLADHYG